MWGSDLRRIAQRRLLRDLQLAGRKMALSYGAADRITGDILHDYNFRVKIPDFLKYRSSVMTRDAPPFEIEICVPAESEALRKMCTYP